MTIKEQFVTWFFNIVVGLLFASIPFGLVMSYVMQDAWWLWFVLPIVIFLS